jgi:tetratricopeptide (TPR) repeat protein
MQIPMHLRLTLGAAVLLVALVLSHQILAAAPPENAQVVQQIEAEFAAARTPLDRFYALGPAAKLRAAAGDMASAQAMATELLALTPNFTANWNYGNAIHDAHVVAGRVAVQRGDLAAARTHLAAAGATPGSPQLNSFGPNMTLARDLLARGERDAVLRYFDACAKFWDAPLAMPIWRAQVRLGMTPWFGANLLY